MTDPNGLVPLEPTPRRAHTLARLAAYSLGFVFVVNVLTNSFPLPLRDPGQAMNLSADILDRSPLLVLAVVLLYQGLGGDGLPSTWECRLTLVLRPVLRLLPLLYLLLILVIGVAGHRAEARTVNGMRHQLDRSLQGIAQLRDAVGRPSDITALTRLVDSQPVLRESLKQAGVRLDPNAPLEEQRLKVSEQLDRGSASLRAGALRSIADVGGTVLRQQIRLVMAALAYALFFFLACMIWPRSMAGPISKARARFDAATSP